MALKTVLYIDHRRIGMAPHEFLDPLNGAVGHPFLRENWNIGSAGNGDNLMALLGGYYWRGWNWNEAEGRYYDTPGAANHGHQTEYWHYIGNATQDSGLSDFGSILGTARQAAESFAWANPNTPNACVEANWAQLDYKLPGPIRLMQTGCDAGPGYSELPGIELGTYAGRPMEWIRLGLRGPPGWWSPHAPGPPSLSAQGLGTWNSQLDKAIADGWGKSALYDFLTKDDGLGDPVWVMYLLDGFNNLGNTLGLYGASDWEWSSGASLPAIIGDDSQVYYDITTSTMIQDPDDTETGPNFTVDIKPVYNHYNFALEDTFPRTGLSERALPNYYMMHYVSPSTDTGASSTLPPQYANQINLFNGSSQTVDWGNSPINQAAAGLDYFSNYRTALLHLAENTGDRDNVESYMQRYKKLAIRPTSVAGIDGLTNNDEIQMLLPFYVDINFNDVGDFQ